jgi:hypothetical protein
MCHNLGSSSFLGYCNVYHMERGLEEERKEAQRKREEMEKQKASPKENTSSQPTKS